MALFTSTSIIASAASALPLSADDARDLAASKFFVTAAGSKSSTFTASGHTISYQIK